jgi:hypothetical protein
MKAASGSSNIAAMGVLTDVKPSRLRLTGDWWEEDTSKNNFDSIINEHSICYFLDKALHREPRCDMRC